MHNLILTRRKKESVVVYNKEGVLIKIVVTALGAKQVKLAFEAEDTIRIDREEIYNARK